MPEITNYESNQTDSSLKFRNKYRKLVDDEFVKRLKSKSYELPESDDILGLIYQSDSLEYWFKLLISYLIPTGVLMMFLVFLRNFTVSWITFLPLIGCLIFPLSFSKFFFKNFIYDVQILTKDSIFSLRIGWRKISSSRYKQLKLDEIESIRFKRQHFGKKSTKGTIEILKTDGSGAGFEIDSDFDKWYLKFLSIMKNKGILHRVMLVEDTLDTSQKSEDNIYNKKVNQRAYKTESILSQYSQRRILRNCVIGIPIYFVIALLYVYFFNRTSEKTIVFWFFGSFVLLLVIVVMVGQTAEIVSHINHTNKKDTNIMVSSDSIEILSETKNQDIVIPFQKDMIIHFYKIAKEYRMQDEDSNKISIKYLNNGQIFTIGGITQIKSLYNNLIRNYISWIGKKGFVTSLENMDRDFQNKRYYSAIIQINDNYKNALQEFKNFVLSTKDEMLKGNIEYSKNLIWEKMNESHINGHPHMKEICQELYLLSDKLDMITILHQFPEMIKIGTASEKLGMTVGELVKFIFENKNLMSDFQIQGDFIIKKVDVPLTSSKETFNVNTPQEMLISRVFDKKLSSL
ncbi:MAG: hypothetical protein ACTSRE_07210 [Promethearchaeota archaeon]